MKVLMSESCVRLVKNRILNSIPITVLKSTFTSGRQILLGVVLHSGPVTRRQSRWNRKRCDEIETRRRKYAGFTRYATPTWRFAAACRRHLLGFHLVMDFLVSFAFVASRKAFRADCAAVRFFAGVRAHVRPQVVASWKTPVAFSADEWLVSWNKKL